MLRVLRLCRLVLELSPMSKKGAFILPVLLSELYSPLAALMLPPALLLALCGLLSVLMFVLTLAPLLVLDALCGRLIPVALCGLELGGW